jgi:chlorobactene glucosyltransferase
MIAVEALLLLLAVAALLNTIVNLLTAPRLRAAAEPAVLPPLSVIIPARNEERVIERTVRAMLAQSYQPLEVIVVDDRSTDSTGAILRSFRDPRLVVVEGSEPPPGWLGKPWALDLGSRRATGELLLFADADICYAPGALEAAVRHFRKRGVALLALMPRFVLRGFWENVLMPYLAEFLFMLFPIRLGNASRSERLAVGGGAGNLVSREVYDALGGHQTLRDAIVDDIGIARLFRRAGYRTELVLADDFVSVRMYHGLREIVEGFTKNAFSVFDRSYVLVTMAVFATLVLNLLPYVLACLGHPISLVTVAVVTTMRLVLSAGLGYRLDVALVAQPLMMVVWTWIFVRSMWHTGVRRRLAWRGRSYDAGGTR